MSVLIKLPQAVRAGEVIDVQLRVRHPMETGFRRNEEGRIARNVITALVCRLDGREVFRADLSPGISANPLIEFPLRVGAAGTLEVSWVDEAGQRGSAEARLVPVG